MSNFTPEEDRLLIRLRADGMRWYEIADRLSWSQQACMVRYGQIGPRGRVVQPARAIPAPSPARRTNAVEVPVDQRVSAAIDGSRRLLAAQLRTGQFFGRQRAEWLKRHGERA